MRVGIKILYMDSEKLPSLNKIQSKIYNQVKTLKTFDDIELQLNHKLPWSCAPLFALFWLVLYWTVAASQINHLPRPLNLKDDREQSNKFIAERALQTLLNLTSIGPRVVGSVANEFKAVNFLINEIKKVQSQATEQIEIEWDVQEASGSYLHWSMLNMYQSVQNVVVRLKHERSTSDNYLLINSHYDSAPGSPGAGDDGSMVAVMLEIMRLLAKSTEPLKNPIIFLFNGAEENPLQASHAFITQHKWAKKCKCLINLDSAGNGGRELLFQSGPEHPWLMRYYRHVPHPFANTLAEEMFQAGFIPSDTDFRIFRDYGQIPGYDMAYIFNGYVYHTQYDRVHSSKIAASLQHTGDNVLTLTKLLANAEELDNAELNSDGHVIFYDFLGWFIVFYTAPMGVFINILICVMAATAILISLYIMSLACQLTKRIILTHLCVTFIIQILSITMASLLTLFIALLMDVINRSMSWYSEKWLLMGLYFCPMIFGMGIGPAYYVQRTKKNPFSLLWRLQLFMFSHCLLLIVITVLFTCLGIRSAFIFVIAVFFQMLTTVVNLLIKKWLPNDKWFLLIAIIGQILPFVYYTSIAHLIYATLIPMTGRSGSNQNPDLLMSALAIFCSILSVGFILPIFLIFRKTCTFMSTFLLLTWLFLFMAITSLGFPYRTETSSQRVNLIHTHRILHQAEKGIPFEESGLYVYPQDRRINTTFEYFKLLGELRRVKEYCQTNMFCAMPLFNHRWHSAREQSFWIPMKEKPVLPGLNAELKLLSLEYFNNTALKRFTFNLKGPDHMTIFVGVKNNAKIINWSFNKALLSETEGPPYFIYYSYGKNNTPLSFYIDVKAMPDTFNDLTLEIGIGSHWIHQRKNRTQNYQIFIDSLPDWISVTDWVATYVYWLF